MGSLLKTKHHRPEVRTSRLRHTETPAAAEACQWFERPLAQEHESTKTDVELLEPSGLFKLCSRLC